MTWSASFNFRATSGYVTDATGETYAIASDTYPTTRSMNGGGSSVTFGLESGLVGTRDRTTASPNNPELSGIWFVQVAASAVVFRVDLPAAGSYVIRVAAGDASAVNEAFYTVFDNATAVITQAQALTSAANDFYDATGVQRTASAWQSSNASQTVTFASTICRLQINGPTGNSSVIAHFSIAEAGGGGDVTVALTGQSATLAEGTFAPAAAVAMSGQATALTQGTLAPATSAALAGQSVALAQGTLAPSVALALSGQALTLSQGTLTAQAGGNVTVSLSGLSAALTQGALAPSIALALSGDGLTLSQGALVNALAVGLPGQSVDVAQGIVTESGGMPASTGAGYYPPRRQKRRILIGGHRYDVKDDFELEYLLHTLLDREPEEVERSPKELRKVAREPVARVVVPQGHQATPPRPGAEATYARLAVQAQAQDAGVFNALQRVWFARLAAQRAWEAEDERDVEMLMQAILTTH